MVAGLVVVSGCNTSSSGGSAEFGTFELKGPMNMMATEVKPQGENTVKITVKPDKNFKEDLTFTAKVEPADKGVTAEPSPATLKSDAPREVEVKIKASEKASPGKYVVHVSGKPTRGKETTVNIEVKVPEK
jgi:uncharacterized membrane protein